MTPFFEETVPVCIKYLGNLIALIEKAETHARKKKISPEVFLKKRLHPTMFTFREQIGYGYFLPPELVGRFTHKKIPEFSYDEKRMKELKMSLRRARSFLKTIHARDFKVSKNKKIPLFFNTKRTVPAHVYVRYLMMPDFFFHSTTAYDILRHSGVPLKKSDYLGARV